MKLVTVPIPSPRCCGHLRRRERLLPDRVRVRRGVVAGVAHAAQVVDRRAAPHVLVVLGVPARGGHVEGLDRLRAVQHDLVLGLVHGGDPPVAVDAALLVPPGVHLVVRARVQRAVADRPVLRRGGLRERVRPRRDRLGLEGGHRPRARDLAQPVQVALRIHREDQPHHTAAGARVQVELDRAAVVRVSGVRDANARVGRLVHDRDRVVRTADAVHGRSRRIDDPVLVADGTDLPRLARGDRRDRRPRLRIPEPDLDRPRLRLEPDRVLALGEPDPQVLRRARSRARRAYPSRSA